MKPIPFAAGHAAHRDWRVALARALDDMLHDARVATAHAAGGGELPAEYTLGLCYLTDAFAGDAEAILAELKLRLPGVHWVGTVGVGVAATGAEHFDVPALALMLAPLPRTAFRVFSGVQPLRADGADFQPHTALVHADGRMPDLQELLPELAERTASGYLFGGLSPPRAGAACRLPMRCSMAAGCRAWRSRPRSASSRASPRAASRSGRGASSAARRTTS